MGKLKQKKKKRVKTKMTKLSGITPYSPASNFYLLYKSRVSGMRPASKLWAFLPQQPICFQDRNEGLWRGREKAQWLPFILPLVALLCRAAWKHSIFPVFIDFQFSNEVSPTFFLLTLISLPTGAKPLPSGTYLLIGRCSRQLTMKPPSY
jgi:hypothetical protein